MVRRKLLHCLLHPGKKGTEMVEASLVLPLLILTIASMIMLLVLFYSTLLDQVRMHDELSKSSEASSRIFYISRDSRTTSLGIYGIVKDVYSRESTGRTYGMNESLIVRAGEMVDFNGKEFHVRKEKKGS
jgi:hypothetical protein